ncbi:MAG: hypothetical protein KF744_14460 [Taibaiella sp.]|nr:hypothetical protein [Taibaiella sp.]
MGANTVIDTTAVLHELNELYLDLLMAKARAGTIDRFENLISKLKANGYRIQFEHCDELATTYYQHKALHSKKLEATENREYESAHRIRDEEKRVAEKLVNSTFITFIPPATILFKICLTTELE